MKPRKANKDDKANSLWTLREDPKGLKKFIDAHPLEVEKESLGRYIDASAKPLDNRKANRSKSDADNFGGYK